MTENKKPSEIIAALIDEHEDMKLLIKNLKDRIRILEEQVSLLLTKMPKE